MSKKWSKEDLLSVLESLLFVSDKPLKVSDFLTCLGESLKPSDVKDYLNVLKKECEKNHRGFMLREVAGGYQFVTKDENKEYIQYLKKTRPFRLSKPSLEVLAIIAYRQPCTRSEINRIRRTDSGHVLKTLLDRNLVSFAGQSTEPGKPMLYKTTKKFLEVYGLKSLKGLPSLEDIKNEFTVEDAEGEESMEFNLKSISESIDS